MSRGARVLAVAGATAVAVVLVAIYVADFLAANPTPLRAAPAPGGAQLTLQTVASYGHQPHPDWVSYLARDGSGRWHHTTVFKVPAHALVRVTIYQYDTATGLRNPFWSQVRGTIGGTMTVDGRTMNALPPEEASHTFAVPELGISVPLKGVAEEAPNQCEVAPCTAAQAHTTVTFTFRTGNRGRFRWQCFVPCAASFVFGNGGPMQSIGWMDGYVQVV
ncbi:MAG TPA: hypothetical protein VN635_05410 [Conexibacter sp.]|nr:hypothetical protein [Conexibacter sp.]